VGERHAAALDERPAFAGLSARQSPLDSRYGQVGSAPPKLAQSKRLAVIE
jgi:hypothetical protein